MALITVDTVLNGLKSFHSQIAEAEDVTTLDEEEMTTLLSDCGLTMKLTVRRIFLFADLGKLQKLLNNNLLFKFKDSGNPTTF